MFAAELDASGAPTPIVSRHSYEQAAKLAVNGSGMGPFQLPPFNSTGTPPISLLWLDTCWNGYNDSFEAALFPYQNIYDAKFVNQAVVGFNLPTSPKTVKKSMAVAFEAMADDRTIDQTVAALVRSSVMDVIDPPVGWPTPKYRKLQRTDVNIMGDLFARQNGVYTGSPSKAVKEWYY